MRRVWALAASLSAMACVASPAAADFPAADSGYHNYAEMAAETLAVANAYPALVKRFSIGTSYEGRTLWALKVSDNVATDEAEPEVLFTANQHAREHLTVEMALYVLDELTSKYATDARIRNVVDTREIWIVPSVNPDGAEFDIATGGYVFWRKNRQGPGTDLNRNWAYMWACCGGSSSDPQSELYHGSAAFSEPETQRLRDFVLSRRIGGVQQIRTNLDFHSYGEQFLYPYGFTFDDLAPGLSQDQRDTFAVIGAAMAQPTGIGRAPYTAEQASDLYISDGALKDWLWAEQGVFGYTVEMSGGSGGFYPPDEEIAPETLRLRESVLRLLETSDCPYRAIGKQAQYCSIDVPPAAPPPPPPDAPPPPPSAAGSASALVTATTLVNRVAVAANGSIRLRMRCVATEPKRCRGSITLKVRLPGRRKAAVVAFKQYTIAGGSKIVNLRLRTPALRALRRRGKLTATMRITTRQDGGAATQAAARITLVRRR
jgi:hypothetical protein